MLQWNPKVTAILAITLLVTIAALLANFTWQPPNFTW
jgi:hypothetical protein